MKIAVISDVHGNIIALERVLKDIEAQQIEQVYCLGDLVDFAPWDNEVISCIRERNIPCVLGNHDERIAFDRPVTSFDFLTEEENAWRKQAIDYTKENISADNKRWLGELPFQIELSYRVNDTLKRIVLIHATLESNSAYLYKEDDKTELAHILKRDRTDVLVMGHTHLPYVQKDSGILLINSGSVGRSREDNRKASYAIIELNSEGISAEIRRLDYPIERVAQAIYKSGIPDYYADFLLGKYSGVR